MTLEEAIAKHDAMRTDCASPDDWHAFLFDDIMPLLRSLRQGEDKRPEGRLVSSERLREISADVKAIVQETFAGQDLSDLDDVDERAAGSGHGSLGAYPEKDQVVLGRTSQDSLPPASAEPKTFAHYASDKTWINDVVEPASAPPPQPRYYVEGYCGGQGMEINMWAVYMSEGRLVADFPDEQRAREYAEWCNGKPSRDVTLHHDDYFNVLAERDQLREHLTLQRKRFDKAVASIRQLREQLAAAKETIGRLTGDVTT